MSISDLRSQIADQWKIVDWLIGRILASNPQIENQQLIINLPSEI